MPFIDSPQNALFRFRVDAPDEATATDEVAGLLEAIGLRFGPLRFLAARDSRPGLWSVAVYPASVFAEQST